MPGGAAPERRILIVDDDAHTRNLLRDLCEAMGFAVHLATDGVQALEALPQVTPELVLLDLMMPRKDGFEVLEEIRASEPWRELPVMLITAVGDLDGKIRGMELGADDFITKPFRVLDLQTRLQAALRVRDYKRRLHAAEDQLAELRVTDPVTGAGTYAQLKTCLDAELSRSRRFQRPMATLLLAFDDFPRLRHELGRDGVDGFLAGMARALRERLRGADRVFRLDVDELVIVLPETDLRGAHVTGLRLSEALEAFSRSYRPQSAFDPLVRISGASFPHPKVTTAEDLLREAARVHQRLRDQGVLARVFAV